MKSGSAWRVITILAHAFAIWVACGSTMWIGMAVASVERTLLVHAIVAPLASLLVALIYFNRFGYTAPLQTAIIFIALVVFMDLFVVALLILRSLEMFSSVVGTWIPFASIFLVTYLTGLFVTKSR
ncbi:hypothetical protein AMJ39_07765 [candidate division TA06 bacterium DG_24]|uniref:Uncharacterized protein n=2 Tax=Bacteria division TA06 TaxID=1156500 RepID=A0A0S8GAG9_UNCT6|nr:MAG: hypothetical protein AMJ39_07765 [candidate division TA06 bacterium DG_24]KPK70021.1 MAG: hypothetical protein AMJ82_04230 [candidate division TA06 bacterium SM23_40]